MPHSPQHATCSRTNKLLDHILHIALKHPLATCVMMILHNAAALLQQPTKATAAATAPGNLSIQLRLLTASRVIPVMSM
jgi:uncharacterized protein YciW